MGTSSFPALSTGPHVPWGLLPGRCPCWYLVHQHSFISVEFFVLCATLLLYPDKSGIIGPLYL